jgi:hypothetical protein
MGLAWLPGRTDCRDVDDLGIAPAVPRENVTADELVQSDVEPTHFPSYPLPCTPHVPENVSPGGQTGGRFFGGEDFGGFRFVGGGVASGGAVVVSVVSVVSVVGGG